jgi:hypothetical protein
VSSTVDLEPAWIVSFLGETSTNEGTWTADHEIGWSRSFVRTTSIRLFVKGPPTGPVVFQWLGPL